ncbi:OmpP1/FadL family transporter [Flammeovirga agarivorans]|uniref:Outer membrane protein transport protein (OMPP1/FadL/TodX) n=1 Tax=Flammeovirga agarivorans TaxID=2726742 RepID=A0A7X8SQH1_9BACT|nr:outer membrane protein transport protein [Flammeovirga agarivorans]NLR94527.1 hypothetical protein [Flammeovirga agarivorans]
MINRTYRRLFFLSALFLIFSLSTYAQNLYPPIGYYNDAVRFSQQNLAGSSRIRAIGGAGVSLGGDISHAMLNPAGLGFFRKSEYHVSMGIGMTGTEASGNGITGDANQTRFFLPELGIVWAKSKSDNNSGSKWRGGSFAITFNRIADYNSDLTYTEDGSNPTSLLNYLEESAFGIAKSNMDLALQDYNNGYALFSLAEMAYAIDLIKPVYGDDPDSYNYYFIADRDNGYGVPSTPIQERKQSVKTRGGQYETTFAYGANYDDKLYLGAKFGVQNVNYSKTTEYYELRNEELTYLGLAEDFQTNGWGVNLSVGLIWRPVDAIRIGATYTSPTWYALTDYYQATMARDYDNKSWDDAEYQQNQFVTDPNGNYTTNVYNPEGALLSNPNASDTGSYNGMKTASHERLRTNYNLNTPWKTSGGISAFLGKKGFITADVEYVGYSAMKINKGETVYLEGTFDAFTVPLNFEGDNFILGEEYRNTINIRLGAEYRLNPKFMLRGGFAYYQDPHKEEYNLGVDQSKQFYTGGLGYRNKKFYMDFAVIFSTWKSIDSPYQLSDNASQDGQTILIYPIADVNNTRTELQLSIGKRF